MDAKKATTVDQEVANLLAMYDHITDSHRTTIILRKAEQIALIEHMYRLCNAQPGQNVSNSDALRSLIMLGIEADRARERERRGEVPVSDAERAKIERKAMDRFDAERAAQSKKAKR